MLTDLKIRQYFEKADQTTFRRVCSESKLIVDKTLHGVSPHLRQVINLALKNKQVPSEYPFLFKYSYLRNKEEESEELAPLSAAIHLLQTSTFVIDDILDFADSRNHGPTVYSKYGVNYAIIGGELLQSIALRTICEEVQNGKFSNKGIVLTTLNEAVRNLYMGQYLDVYNSSNPNISINDYNRVISLTTGCFLANIGKCGALLAGKSPAEIKSIYDHADYYGMALQITDDILDLIYDSRVTGKTFASDLKGHRMRLPLIMALRMTNKKDAAFLKRFLLQKKFAEADLKACIQIILNCDAIPACKSRASSYLKRSLKSISSMRKGLTRSSLTWLSESLLAAQGLNED
jgi:geranylgeranyl pyrophosphate synthase